MYKYIFSLICLLGVALGTSAQGYRYQNVIQGPRGPLANVPVAVCSQPATISSAPCSPLATLYTDSTLTTACNGTNGCSNPLTSDGYGNVLFYAAPGKYTIQYYGPQFSAPVAYQDIVLPCDPSNCNLTGRNVNGVRYVSPDNSQGWGGSTSDAWITSAISDLLTSSPNGGVVYLSPGAYSFSAGVVNHSSNITVKCLGSGGGPTSNTPTQIAGACTVTWAGSVGGTVLDWSESGTGTITIAGGGVEGIRVDCNNLAAIGLHVANEWYGRFTNDSFHRCTSANIAVDTNPTSAGNRSTQFNLFQQIGIDASGTSGKGIWVSGDAFADAAFNTFDTIRCLFYDNGDCIYLDNDDNDRFSDIGGTREAGGTGIGLHFTSQASNVNQSAREDMVSGIDPGAGGIVQDQFANGNAIWGETLCNGGGLPTISAGELTYSTQSCGGFNNTLAIPIIESIGTAATLTGTGACATLSSQNGGSWDGEVTCTGTTGASTLVITPGTTAPNHWECSGSDVTSGHELALPQSGLSATTCTLKASSVTANDVLSFRAVAH